MTTSPRTTALLAWSALALAVGAFVFSGAGESIAAKVLPGPSLQPKKFGVLRLNAKKKFPASVLPASVFANCSP